VVASEVGEDDEISEVPLIIEDNENADWLIVTYYRLSTCLLQRRVADWRRLY
jgi:hypothetical protein